MEIAKRIRSLYYPGYAFPEWVLDPQIWKTHNFDTVKVFYHAQDSLVDVKKLMTEREPCNIGLKRLYNQKDLQKYFGYSEGAYCMSTKEKLMPNIAVYTHATVYRPNGFVKAHVVNLIGAAFDHPDQPDFKYFQEKPLSTVVEFYRNMWRLALAAAEVTSCKQILLYNVGGGAFAGPFYERFREEIFEPAIKPLLPLFEKKEITVIGYDWFLHTFTSPSIPECLDEVNLETTLFVNAWDPWTLIGNGNERDRSLDGFWGRISNMAILGWLPTNPSIKFMAVFDGLAQLIIGELKL